MIEFYYLYPYIKILLVYILISFLASLLTLYILKNVGNMMMKAGLSGKDLNKTHQPVLPESMGLISGTMYLMVTFLCLPLPFLSVSSSPGLLGYHHLIDLISGSLSICCMILLGFVDDVLNLKWKYKLILPALASLPLLMVYSASSGGTFIAIPSFLQSYFSHTSINLGVLYYIFMCMLGIFCTNSINILAGVNGLEVGQSIVIGSFLLINNLYNIFFLPIPYLLYIERHILSSFILIPFLFTSIPLYLMNRNPAQVFVGDTYCYFSGMLFATTGILGHFSKTLLLFFIPQIMNFIYSLPQLIVPMRFGGIPCPRHRLPRLNKETGCLEMSLIKLKMKKHGLSLVYYVLKLLSKLKLVYLVEEGTQSKEQIKRHQICELENDTEDKDDEHYIYINNLTLINLMLYWGGPVSEDKLTRRLLWFQIITSSMTFVLRYQLAKIFYGNGQP